MLMVIKIGWRNIWRNLRRSLITIGAMVIGLWGLIMIYGANNGMMVGMVNMAITAHSSHIQLHARGYHDDPGIRLTFKESDELVERVSRAERVAAAAPRGKVRSMLSTSHASSGIMLVGIDPERESQVTTIDDSIKEGRYFTGEDEKGILVGRALAEKLKTGVGRKVVVYARGADMELKLLGLKVTGLFDTGMDTVDKFIAFVPLDYFQQSLALDGRIHEIAVRVEEDRDLEAAKASIISALPADNNLEVLTWKEMFKFLVQLIDMAKIGNYAMLFVVGVAMALGIANTMVMSVYERFREIGIMKAVGTSPWRVFTMILTEAVLLGITGLIAGSLIGWLSLLVWDVYGLDLTAFSESLKSVGMPAVIFPDVYLRDWLSTWIVVVGMSVLASVYPALKAARQRPVEAMRM